MSEDTVCLHIQLIGSAAISGWEIPLAVNQLKSRALLYYLAATGESHTRDHLAPIAGLDPEEAPKGSPSSIGAKCLKSWAEMMIQRTPGGT